MAFGLVDNILVYSYGLKRKSRTNIVLGGFSGGAPALIGYVAVTTTGLWDFGLVIAGLVFVWIPMHIWALTLHFKDDYQKVNVPMLTAIGKNFCKNNCWYNTNDGTLQRSSIFPNT